MTIRPVGSDLFRAVRRTDGRDEAIRRYMEMFVSNVFYNNWPLQWMYKLLQQFILQVCWIRRLYVNKYCKWTHSTHQRYPAVDCHLYCSVNLLCQQPLFPLNRSLMFLIADPATFVPDRNEILTRGTVTARRICSASTNFENINYIQLCSNVPDSW